MENMGKNKKKLTRREFIKTSASGIGGLALSSYLMPRTASAQKPIRILAISIFTGRAAVLGLATKNGLTMWQDEVNQRGGILGRKVEIEFRDTRGKVEEAVRLAREAASSGQVDFIMDGCSSREAFAVKEVAKDLKFLIFALQCKTTEFTADPKIFNPYSFRIAGPAILDLYGGGQFAAEISKKNGWKKWVMIGPDYAYGHDMVNSFTRFLKKGFPEVEIQTELWPKLDEPDFTPHIAKIIGANVDAVFSSQWGGDLVALLQQGAVYGLWEKVKLFVNDLGDFTVINPVIKALGKVPEGIYMGTRSNPVTPNTKLNQDWFNNSTKKFGTEPSGWDNQAYTGGLFLNRAIEKARTTDQKAVIKALKGLEIIAPWGTPPSQKLIMRDRDHTVIHYNISWGTTISKYPYVTDIYTASWKDVLKAEEEFLREKGWLK